MSIQIGICKVEKGDKLTVERVVTERKGKVKETLEATEAFTFQWDGSLGSINELVRQGRLKAAE